VSRCRSCGAGGLAPFLSLGEQPLADALVPAARCGAPEPRHPLDVAFCPACSLVQLLASPPPETLFGPEYPYYSSFSDTLLEHSRRHAERRCRELVLGPESLVIELASNDGYLLQHYQRRGIAVLGIDPAPGPARAARARGIPTLEAFFDRGLAARLRAEGIAADLIHAHNVLAHVPDPNELVAGIAALLAPGGRAVIEVPWVKDLVDHGEFDTIYHEHHAYFSATALRGLFRRHGLTWLEVEHLPIHGGSLRAELGLRDAGAAADEGASVARLLALEAGAGLPRLDYYAGFAARVEQALERLRALIGELRTAGRRVAAYGAAAKGSVLLNAAGLGRDLIEFVVDRNPHKHGHSMPGLGIPILPPAALLERRPDDVLLLAWNFRDEILAQQAEFLRGGGRFVVPVPALEIVGAEALS
jgi:SAM-dependent methyltransferase